MARKTTKKSAPKKSARKSTRKAARKSTPRKSVRASARKSSARKSSARKSAPRSSSRRQGLRAARVNWKQFTKTQIKAICKEARAAGDEKLYTKAKAALARRS